MKIDVYGQIIFNEEDLFDLVMQGQDIATLNKVVVDPSVDLEGMAKTLESPDRLLTWTFPVDSNQSVIEYDQTCQSNWNMPEKYKQLDIAEYVLGLCTTEAELQRVGQELLLYQERDLFNLLRYLVYLVDVMTENRLIWGVGRGSSVSSHVLFLIKVHRINSLYYNLDIAEFLR